MPGTSMDRMQALYLRAGLHGRVSTGSLRHHLLASGLQVDDSRLAETWRRLENLGNVPLSLEAFSALVAPELLMVSRALHQQLVIPEWQDFQQDIDYIFQQVSANRSGANADYIPILKNADPERWGVAVCSVDGQRLALGDVDDYHSIQSVSKPITYAYALSRETPEITHQYVGVEPSGRPFNDLSLLPDRRPFNPNVNAGAIMMAGLVTSGFAELDAQDITGRLMELWADLCGHCGEVRFSETTMQSERATADTNFAIAYLLQGGIGLPRSVDLHKMLDVYFSCCSIEMTARMLSVAAATLANGGVCPITGRQVLSTEIVKRTLAIMQTSGLYDNAGVFTLEVGLPAKSGVAGSVLVVAPNLLGLATFSPRLDSYGNSVRGIAFCKELGERFHLHIYDNLSGGHSGGKRDPRASRQRKRQDLSDLRWGVGHGDTKALLVRDLILHCIVDVGLADGELEASELAAMERIYQELMETPAEPGAFETLARERHHSDQPSTPSGSPFDRLIAELSEQRDRIDDTACVIILETAFRVACADGIIATAERQKLQAIAAALGINPGVVQLEINAFQRAQNRGDTEDLPATANGGAECSGSQERPA
jgi:glutaminase